MRKTEQTVLVQSIKNPRVTRRMTANSARLNSSHWKILHAVNNDSPKIEGVIRMCVCTAIWKRHNVFKIFAKWIKTLQSKDVDITVIVAGSEGEISRKLVETEGFVYVETPNEPLAKKHNEAIKKAKDFNPHCVMLTGSDDIISVEAFQIYLKKIREGYDFIGTTDFYFWDNKTRKAAYWGGYIDHIRKGHTCGAFRLFSVRLIQNWGWQPFEIKHSHVLDNSTQQKLKSDKHKSFVFSLKDAGVLAVDIKSEVNMTPFKLWDNTKYIDTNIIKNKFHL